MAAHRPSVDAGDGPGQAQEPPGKRPRWDPEAHRDSLERDLRVAALESLHMRTSSVPAVDQGTEEKGTEFVESGGKVNADGGAYNTPPGHDEGIGGDSEERKSITEVKQSVKGKEPGVEKHDRDDQDSNNGLEEDLVFGPVLPVQLAWLGGCRKVDECYEKLNKVDEGMYGVVYRARDRHSGQIVALKRVKLHKELVQREGFPITALREINLLLQIRHPNIVGVKEVVMGDANQFFMVMSYADHDVKSLMEAMHTPFSLSEVKCLLLQLLHGVEYLHRNWLLHRDLKASNLLLSHSGVLRICDFGLARVYGSPLRAYTPYNQVVTLWYRSPELLLGCPTYSTAVDMWSVGCIFAELLLKKPLFPGKNEVDQMGRIIAVLGAPQESIWPGLSDLPNPFKIRFKAQPYNRLRQKFPKMAFDGGTTLSDNGFDMLNRLLTYDPSARISAAECLNHPFFREIPIPKDASSLPKFPSTHEVEAAHRKARTPEAKDRLLQMLRQDEARFARNAARDRHYEVDPA